LVEAAAELFAARGPHAVSVREVAGAAGVNHGLVHHYFGSKEGLVVAVLEELAARSAAELDSGNPPETIYAEDGAAARHGRILAFLLLSGADLSHYKRGFPTADALIARCRHRGLTARAARERAAQTLALVTGWQLFEPFITAATGLEQSSATRARVLGDALARLLRPGP
jgi:AcrR family transcriptional regulator